MSTGLNCEFIEWESGRWYYVLERPDAPKVTWDWREYANAYGPFENLEDAEAHLRRTQPNPGGSCTLQYDPKYKEDTTLVKLICNAEKPVNAFWEWYTR